METDAPTAKDVGEGESFGSLLRQMRLAHGLTQEELAERAGLSVRGISDLERGTNQRARPDTFARLAHALGLDPTERDHLDRLLHRYPARRMPVPALPSPRGIESLSPATPQGLHVHRCERERGGTTQPRDEPGRALYLPTPLSSFVGREHELDEVTRGLEGARLLTLTGPPGVGKTRLALAAAARLCPDFPDGIGFVPLAAVRDPDLVLAAIAQSVGVEGTERQPLLGQLAEVLRGSRILLVLDNFEQVVAAGPTLSELLSACPGIVALVTSRVRLRVRGERELQVPPVSLPEGRPGTKVRNAMSAVWRSEAARLFVERAREAGSDFAVSPENAQLIAEICRQLDGSPLAIELAAAWVRTVDLPELLARLTRRLDLLTAGPADLPRRQQTWREAIAWSYDLLSPDEQVLFRRLAVFSGGFTLEAAEAVADASLATLTALLDASLVQRLGSTHATAAPRFAMLETIRDDAGERLRASGEAVTRQSRHADYFLTLAEAARKTLHGPEERVGLDRIEPEHDNLRAALSFHLDQAPAGGAFRLLKVVGLLWVMRGYVDEVRQWWARTLEPVLATGSPKDRADALRLSGRMAWKQSDNVVAWSRLEEKPDPRPPGRGPARDCRIARAPRARRAGSW